MSNPHAYQINISTHRAWLTRVLVTCVITLAFAGATARAQDDPAAPRCKFGAIDKTVGVNNVPEHPESHLNTLCLPDKLAIDSSGKVRCEVRATQFEDRGTAERVCREYFQARVHLDEQEVPYCLIRQLSRNQPLASQGPGFFYDDRSSATAKACRDAKQRIGFAPDDLLYILEQFRISTHCELTLPENVGCSVPSQSADAVRHVGQACEFTPIAGDQFSPSESFLSSLPATCGSGMCLGYGLNGSIASDCDSTQQRCVDATELREHMRCTCRCSAADPGDAPLCTCPSGFACEPILQSGPAAGGYCVDEQILHYRP